MPRFGLLSSLVPLGLATLVSLRAAPAAGPVDFRRDVLPILSDTCFRCHGPDEGTRKAKLRLDTKEGLYRTLHGLTVVAPGSAADSELVVRIKSDDPDEVMPPRDAVRQLKPAEISVLERWVTEGAPWSAHWAFTPLAQAQAVPAAVTTPEASPIDTFVRARLVKEGLQPAPEASHERLLRRITFDLTGLPPTPAEIDAFVADTSPQAYERVVDRLLASPRYGERQALEWLDIARYADTHGYQMDRPRAMWAYRDWVIQAFNENLPFDQFTTWQLAGDLLPQATKTQRLATAFNRLHNQNEEGGIVEEEYRVAYVADRVATFGTAFLGLTFECARCHDHKFDPITARDYYSLFAFFQNIDEAGQISYTGFANAMPVPTLLLTTPEQDAQLEKLRAETAAAESALQAAVTSAKTGFQSWLRNGRASAPPQPRPDAYYRLDALEQGFAANDVDAQKPGRAEESPRIVETDLGPAAELTGENGFTFPGVGHFSRTDAFSLSLWLQPPAAPAARAVVVHHSKAPADAGSRGYELLLENGRVAFGLHYLWPGASLKVVSREPLPLTRWSHVTVTYDGSSRASGTRVYVNGKAVEVEVIRDGLFKDITYTGTEPDLTIGYRFRDSGFKSGRVTDLAVFSYAVSPLEAATLAGRSDLTRAWTASATALTKEQTAGLQDYYLTHLDPSVLAARRALQQLRVAQNTLVQSVPEAMVMDELPQPKPAHILVRGAYDAPGAAVTADTPAALPPFPAHAPRNRLGLARWLTDPGNPLLARVTVNRFWQQMFGQGLVETSDNFGLQGSPPTHPELLDWLASDLIRHGWDVKRTLRQIALSATYRQSSVASAELLARDPQNQLLARGPARRLSAEMLRDQALAASGLLVEKIGGPSVKPYQPPGLWEEIAMGKPKYVVGEGEDLYRRSLYTFWKRTVPPPSMMLFDAAERNVCTVRRQSTSTPLQALALLNDVQVVEAARLVGQRMLKEGGSTPDAWIAWGFRLVTGRRPDKREREILRSLYDEQLALFQADEAAANQFNAFGATSTDATLPSAVRAAAGMVAKALLNFDETVMRR
ncbi:MAG: DUF1553 domain-containing protein [Opitutaceae bacterium]